MLNGYCVRDFSGALPVIVIAEMLGVESERQLDFKRWFDNIALGTSRSADEVVRAQIRASDAKMRGYFQKLSQLGARCLARCY